MFSHLLPVHQDQGGHPLTQKPGCHQSTRNSMIYLYIQTHFDMLAFLRVNKLASKAVHPFSLWLLPW